MDLITLASAPLSGCEHSGASHWWVPPLLALGACFAAAAALPWRRPRPEEEVAPRQLEIRGCRNEELNGIYELDGLDEDGDPRWLNGNCELRMGLVGWLCGPLTRGVAAVQSGRAPRGRLPHNLPGFWLEAKTLRPATPEERTAYVNPDITIRVVGAGPAEGGGGSPSGANIPEQSVIGEESAFLGKEPPTTAKSLEKWKARCPMATLLLAALACWAPIMAVFVQTAQGGLDETSCTLPPMGEPPSPFAECGCAVLYDRVVLPTFAIGALAVVMAFLGNAAIALAKSAWTTGRNASTHQLAEAVWTSLREPNRALLCLSALAQLVHLMHLFIVTSIKDGVYAFYLELNANLVNSGATAFYVNALYGMVLTSSLVDNALIGFTFSEPYPHPRTPAGLRVVFALVMLVVLLPAQVKIWEGMLKWLYMSIPTHTALALAMQAFFPEASDVLSTMIINSRSLVVYGPILSYLYLFCFRLCTPMHEIVAYGLQQARIFQQQSPVGPVLRTLIAAGLCFLYVMEKQFFFNMQLLHELGVPYLEAPSLSYQLRHNRCSVCLAVSAATTAWNHTDVAAEAACQWLTVA